MNVQQYNKAYVPVGVALVLALLGVFHVTGQMTVSDVVTALVTSLGVYLVPNK